MEILQRTVEEQGLAFGGTRASREEERRRTRAKEEERIRADRRLREEQDAAYLAALQIDKVGYFTQYLTLFQHPILSNSTLKHQKCPN